MVLAGATPASSSWYAATSERDILPVLNDGNDASSEPLEKPFPHTWHVMSRRDGDDG